MPYVNCETYNSPETSEIKLSPEMCRNSNNIKILINELYI